MRWYSIPALDPADRREDSQHILTFKPARMPIKYTSLALVALGTLFQTLALCAQAADQASPGGPRVFFDCQGSECDDTYHRTEIPWVTWVRLQQDADIHVIMTSQRTGANGREYQLDVIGREAYSEYEDQSFYQALSTDTQRERLDGVSHALGLSFARFAQFAGFRDLVSLQANRRGPGNGGRGLVFSDQVDDAWNLWVFDVSGNGSFNGEETRTSRRFSGSATASRVTPTWKQSYRTSVNYNFQKTKFPNRPKFVDRRTDWDFDATVVYSVAELWSLGFTSRFGRNTRENQAFWAEINPAVEFSLFPYDEATRRSITVFYEIGPVYYEYLELTQDLLFDETRYKQSLTFAVSQRQTWGDVRLNVQGSHFLHDFDRNNLNVGGFVSFRITRGLDVRFGGNYTLVADQLYLPFDDLTDDELLTGVRRAATDKRYSFFVGLSFQFGSIFNNVVNNRFPGGGGFGNFGGGGGQRGGGGRRF